MKTSFFYTVKTLCFAVIANYISTCQFVNRADFLVSNRNDVDDIPQKQI